MTNPADLSTYVRLMDVPKLLGVTRATVYNRIKAGKMELYKWGSVSFVKREALQPQLVSRTDHLAHIPAQAQKLDLVGRDLTGLDSVRKPRRRKR